MSCLTELVWFSLACLVCGGFKVLCLQHEPFCSMPSKFSPLLPSKEARSIKWIILIMCKKWNILSVACVNEKTKLDKTTFLCFILVYIHCMLQGVFKDIGMLDTKIWPLNYLSLLPRWESDRSKLLVVSLLPASNHISKNDWFRALLWCVHCGG